jgi:nucleotide-binding universal stress UspA family protein
MAKAKPDAPEESVMAYDALLEAFDVQRKGAKNAYTSLNGNMFSYLEKEGALALRLGANAREAFIRRYNSRLATVHNTVMKEYVVVPVDMLLELESVSPHFEESLAYAKTLKAKQTKKPVKK